VTEHERYEALCALAAGGFLEDAEFGDFQAHLQECSECRSNYQELSTLVTRELPQARGNFQHNLAALRVKPLPYSRQRFLRRARSEGVVFSGEVETPAQLIPWYFRPVISVAAVVALAAVAVSLSVYHYRVTPDSARARDAGITQQIADLKQENSALTASLSQLTESLAARQHEVQTLRAQLGNTTNAGNLQGSKGQVSGNSEQSTSQNVQLLDEFQNQNRLLEEARGEVARINELRANDAAFLGAQQVRIAELSDRLRVASATLDMERQLAAAGKDVRELMAARQLHVIDVRDTDPNGNPSKAFGRVFLTDGKSLTFYAFDLNEDRPENATRSFQVWAVPKESKNSARSLGFLNVDAKAQGRWALDVENPEIVKDINSVYVTVEPATGGKQPSGQKMLYAYLGEPNHP
jgi:hypothetical protein